MGWEVDRSQFRRDLSARIREQSGMLFLAICPILVVELTEALQELQVAHEEVAEYKDEILEAVWV